MNQYQERWWRQAQADHAALVLLRRHAAAPCHQLHYLQMVTEKIGKAYFWRTGMPPPRSHAGFVQFMRFLGGVRQVERPRIADIFEFRRFDDFQNWIRSILPLAYALERLAPTLAQDGPNPEYPWPPNAPTFVPATFDFDVWREIKNTGRGRQLLQVIDIALQRFPEYA